MKDGGLSADAGFVDGCPGIDVSATVEQKSGCGQVAKFRGDMQERGSLKRETATAAHAAVEFGVTAGDKSGVGLDLFRKTVQLIAEKGHYRRSVVFGFRAGIQEKVDAGAHSFYGTRVAGNEVIESIARICAVIQKPLESGWVHGFGGSEDDGEMSVPEGVDVGAVGQEKLHHRDAVAVESGTHEWAIAALVDVRPVGDHPRGHRESGGTRRLPRDATFGDPRERPIFAVTERRGVQRGVARYQRLDANEVVDVDRLFELLDFVQGSG